MSLRKVQCKSCIITENCRVVQGGDSEAFDEACRRLKDEYMGLMKTWKQGSGAIFHLNLEVEYPVKN